MSFTNAAGDTTGANAAGSPILGFALGTVTLATQGLGYRSVPTVLITASGEAPTSDAIIDLTLDEQTGKLATITLTSGGDGYEANPTITLEGGGGNGGVLTVNVQSLVGSITSNGSGYTPGTYNNISWTGSASGTGGTASFTIPGLQGVITAGGSGYKDQNTAYSVEFRNAPTTTYTVTVVQRTKFSFIGTITNGPFQVGETVTTNLSLIHI